jgi:hypothetical protein
MRDYYLSKQKEFEIYFIVLLELLDWVINKEPYVEQEFVPPENKTNEEIEILKKKHLENEQKNKKLMEEAIEKIKKMEKNETFEKFNKLQRR